MSELLDNAQRRRDALKLAIQQLHTDKESPGAKNTVIKLMSEVPYGEVVSVEQELLQEGAERKQILSMCDLHVAAMKRTKEKKPIDVPPGHPIHTFIQENEALEIEIGLIRTMADGLRTVDHAQPAEDSLYGIQNHVHSLMDLDKHYLRKEHLVFPYLEKKGITGPSNVMWAKDDEIRASLKHAVVKLAELDHPTAGALRTVLAQDIEPALTGIEDMIYREDNILWPMGLEQLSDPDWHAVDLQSMDYGFCLYDPQDAWKPDLGDATPADQTADAGRVRFPSGSLTVEQLTAMLNTIPFDLTFVDADDTVRYFTQGRERIFARSRAILGRKVQLCHPPSSVHIVQQILDDFKSNKQDHAPFWIQMRGKFIHIEYHALRNEKGEYLGCLEVSQDLTDKRALEGEQRLLRYSEN